MHSNFFDRKFFYHMIFFWLFMGTILLLIDWKNGIHNFQLETVINYYGTWLIGGFLYSVFRKLLERLLTKKKS